MISLIWFALSCNINILKKKFWAISILLEFIEIIVCENYVHLSNRTKLRNGSLGTVP